MIVLLFLADLLSSARAQESLSAIALFPEPNRERALSLHHQGGTTYHLYEFRAPGSVTQVDGKSVGEWYDLSAWLAGDDVMRAHVSMSLSRQFDGDGVTLADSFWKGELGNEGAPAETSFWVENPTTFYVLVTIAGGEHASGRLWLRKPDQYAELSLKPFPYVHDSEIRGNILFIHGIKTRNEDVWQNQLDFLRKEIDVIEGARMGWRVWSFSYDWKNLSGHTAWNLKERIKHHRRQFQGKPLVIVAHSKGGLVAKAFLGRLDKGYKQYFERVVFGLPSQTVRDEEEFSRFEDWGETGVVPSQSTVVYLDTPHRGTHQELHHRPAAAWSARFGWLADIGNYRAGFELIHGLPFDVAVKQYAIAPSAEASRRDIANRFPVVPLESALGIPVDPGSGIQLAGEYVLTESDLEGFGEGTTGLYLGIHNAVARCRRTFEILFTGLPGQAAIIRGWLVKPVPSLISDYEQVIEAALHHLGDNNFSGTINTGFQLRSEGLKWSCEFELPPSLASRSDGYVVMYLRGAQFSSLVLNGRPIARLRNTVEDNGGNQAIPIPPNVARTGKNILMLLSNVSPQDPRDRDDIEFHKVTIFFGDINPHMR